MASKIRQDQLDTVAAIQSVFLLGVLMESIEEKVIDDLPEEMVETRKAFQHLLASAGNDIDGLRSSYVEESSDG